MHHYAEKEKKKGKIERKEDREEGNKKLVEILKKSKVLIRDIICPFYT